MTTTRPHRPVLAAALLVTALLATACGGDEAAAPTPAGGGSETTSVETPVPPTAQQGPGTFPVAVPHKFGETTIPGPPERVVSVGFTDQDPLLALGVVPAGVRDFFGDQPSATWPWARDLLGGAEPEVLPVSELNFEQIAALRPDLIVSTSGMEAAEYDTLSEIAPTVAQSGDFADNGMPWQERTLQVGRAVGEEGEAQELVDSVTARFTAAREEHPGFEARTVIVASPSSNEGEFFILGEQDRRVRLFTDLGFTLAPGAVQLVGDQFSTPVSGEQIGLLDEADIVIWNTQSAEERAVVTGNPLYQGLAVARGDRAVFLPDEVAPAVSFATVLSIPSALDVMVPLLADKVAALPPP